MKKFAVAVLLVIFCFSVMGCWTMQHQVGSGASSGTKGGKEAVVRFVGPRTDQ